MFVKSTKKLTNIPNWFKSDILFHRNISPQYLYKMTLNEGEKMKNTQEKDYSTANDFKDLETKVVSAITEILSITSKIRNPMPSDGIEFEF